MGQVGQDDRDAGDHEIRHDDQLIVWLTSPIIVMMITMTRMMMMMRRDNSICSDAPGHTREGKKRGFGQIGIARLKAPRGRAAEKGGKVKPKKSRRNNQSDGRGRGGGGGGGKERKRRGKGRRWRMMGDQPPGLVTRPYGNDVVGHDDQVNSSSFSLCSSSSASLFSHKLQAYSNSFQHQTSILLFHAPFFSF